jgi:hypothetical protein
MFPCNLLRLCFTNSLLLRISMTFVHVCTIRLEMAHTTWGSEHFQLSEDFVLTCPQHRGSDHSRLLIHGMPEPSLLGFLPNKTPHVVNFSCFHLVAFDADRAWLHTLDRDLVDVLKLWRFFLTPR